MCGEEELCDGGLVEGFEEGGYWMGMEGGLYCICISKREERTAEENW